MTFFVSAVSETDEGDRIATSVEADCFEEAIAELYRLARDQWRDQGWRPLTVTERSENSRTAALSLGVYLGRSDA